MYKLKIVYSLGGTNLDVESQWCPVRKMIPGRPATVTGATKLGRCLLTEPRGIRSCWGPGGPAGTRVVQWGK